MKLTTAGLGVLGALAALASPARATGRPAAPCDVATTTASIAIGQQASGRIERSDCTRSDGTHADFYRLVVRARTTVSIAMTSNDFDAYLALFDGAGELVTSDDDGAGGTNARIERMLEPGTYYVAANTVRRGETGAYALSAGTAGAGRIATVSAGSSGGACSIAAAQVSIAVGQRASGRLDDSDCVKDDDSYAEYFRLEVRGPGRVAITMRSGDFDAYLAVLSETGGTLDTDDDGAGGTDARIERTLAPGTYYIVANTLREGESGAFTLEVAGAPAASAAGSAGSTGSCTPVPIQLGTAVQGRLSTGDCTQEDDSKADLYQLVVPNGREVTVELRSSAFDAWLVIRDADGDFVDSDDDSAGGTDARLTVRLPAGTYVIVANSLQEDGRGAYTLSVGR